MLGWLVTTVLYLLGAGVIFSIDYKELDCWEDWMSMSLVGIIWPILVFIGICIVIKTELDERQARQNAGFKKA